MLKPIPYTEREKQIEKQTREDAIKEGRADGARKFAEWLSNTEYVTSQGHFILPLRGYFTIDEVVSEWEKEK